MLVTVELCRSGRFVSYISMLTDALERNKVMLLIYYRNYNNIRGENIKQSETRR